MSLEYEIKKLWHQIIDYETSLKHTRVLDMEKIEL